MKKAVIVFSLAIAVALSCQPEVDFEPESKTPAGGVTVTATYEQPSSGTKTSLTGDCKVLWSAGDEVALMTPTTRDRFVLTNGEKTAIAEFTGTISGEAPFCLLYPYSESCAVADGKLKFTLPREQTVSAVGTFGQGASPAVAVMDDYNSPVQFKNLCGVLEINVYGSGVNIMKIAVSDLAGAPLWGDCEVDLDGTQGTDGQKMTVTGGSSTVILNLTKSTSLRASSPTKFDIVVPAGSLSKGFTIKFFDSKGNASSFATTLNPAAKVGRSKVSVMSNTKLLKEYGEPADVRGRGYYKEIMVDNGVDLTGIGHPPAIDSLGWRSDCVDTQDTACQNKYIIGYEDDYNGILLYPDNEPRYRMVYVNGGSATSHGRSLTSAGRARFLTFVNNGGSYSGSCAGAYIASTGSDNSQNKNYFGVYPAMVMSTNLTNAYTDMTIPDDSPLLKYYDFGGDHRIAEVRHNGGCYTQKSLLPAGAEILLNFIRPGHRIDGKASAWAYKANDVKGRVVVTGSHPEAVTSGENLNMMKFMYLYAVDGNGKAMEKGALSNGQERKMDQPSSAGKPANAVIGDRQYHHFRVEIPAGGAKDFTLRLASDSGKNLMLALRKGDLAWRTDADYLLAQSGGNKTLSIDFLPEGTWYVSVYGSDAPDAVCGSNTFRYKGDIALLNGIPYSITASWK